MTVSYLEQRADSGFGIDFFVKLSKEQVQSIDNPPHIINMILSPNSNREIKRNFQLKKGVTEDDSPVELHYHLNDKDIKLYALNRTKWKKVEDIHATVSEEVYAQLKRTGKYEGTHDHGLITIVR